MSKRGSSRGNKPRREEAKGKEVSDLKKENNQLRRQLTRLRKQILNLQEMVSAPEEQAVAQNVDNRPKCELCSSVNISEVSFPTGILRVCKDCKHRKTKPKDS